MQRHKATIVPNSIGGFPKFATYAGSGFLGGSPILFGTKCAFVFVPSELRSVERMILH